MNTNDSTHIPIIFAPETYQYDKYTLEENNVLMNPIDQFTKWFNEAKSHPSELVPEAVTLATAELPSGRVSCRVLLFKELDQKGFVIYSNWETSKKAHDIKTNPYAALTFFWKDLQRQVRIEGRTEYVNRETSERYFKTRPHSSKIGAWASPQSKEISGRNELDEMVKKNEIKFSQEDDIPCPKNWGGLRVVPLEIEFWQGRPSRLHDRIVYKRKTENDSWSITRIAP